MRVSRARILALAVIALIVAGCEVASRRSARPIDDRTSLVWPAARVWNAHLEREYGAFVGRLGAAVEAGRCDRLDMCLADPEANALYDPEIDAGLRLDLDCADLPYVLRAYYSFKRGLPFGF